MGLGTREIKRRIRSVKNTQQITKAMHAVAASKMKKAQRAAVQARPYAQKALELLGNLQQHAQGYNHPLLRTPHASAVCIIVFTPDKGLCGSLTTNILKATLAQIAKLQQSGMSVDLITVGKKGADFFKKTEAHIIASFQEFGDQFTTTSTRPISQVSMEDFTAGTYNRVVLIYANFINALSQKVQIKQLLPLTSASIQALAEVPVSAPEATAADDLDDDEEADADTLDEDESPVALEPNPEFLLGMLLPRLVEMQVYHAMLESNASEHSARMIAMKSATDNASDLLADLNLTYNQLRQSGITKEISEIAAGVEALSEQDA